MRLALTGATGSLGGALLQELHQQRACERIVAISRDEVKSGDLAERWAVRLPQLRCSLGDVRDRERLVELFRGCDTVIHAAALKRITHSVYSPGEIIKTNVEGTVNVIQAAVEARVAWVVFVSSDKAVEATNLYGMSKALAEAYAVQANSYTVPRGTRVSCVRYGNVLGSRGSVVHIWRKQLDDGAPLTVTDENMTRFIITLPQAARFVLDAVDRMEGGEIFVPPLPAARMPDLLAAVVKQWGPSGPAPEVVLTGLRPGGEKLHESLISREEPGRTWADPDGGRLRVLPSHHSWRQAWPPPGAPVTKPYTSDEPGEWLSVETLTDMLEDVPEGGV